MRTPGRVASSGLMLAVLLGPGAPARTAPQVPAGPASQSQEPAVVLEEVPR